MAARATRAAAARLCIRPTPLRSWSVLSPSSALTVGGSRVARSFSGGVGVGAGGVNAVLSPAVQWLIRTLKLDASTITPSGPRGRLLKGDVLHALATGTARPLPTTTTTTTTTTTATTATATATGATPATQASSVSVSGRRSRAHVDIATTPVRRVIASRLSESKRTVPHAYTSTECQIDALLALRTQLKARYGNVASVNDFVIRATALALREVPQVNALWDSKLNQVKLVGTVDISVAVATPGGLITPIIRSADRKRINTISTEIKELAGRARDGRLKPEEFQGGTFTISNLGMFGINEFIAVINPPQAAILAVSAPITRVIPATLTATQATPPAPAPAAPAVDSELASASFVTVTLSSDERVVDASTCGRWLEAFKSYLQNPTTMLE